MLSSALRLPAFLGAYLFMYWSLVIGIFLFRIPVFARGNRRQDLYRWSALLLDFFRAEVRKVGAPSLHRCEGPVVYLHNHRSWADFFLDLYTTEARAAPLARWAVFAVFPIICTSALVLRGIIFFKRDRVTDKPKFNAWLDAQVAKLPLRGLLLYPEGHRSLKPEGLALKRGMLRFTHERKWPVQIVITRGKELVMSEKQLRVGFGAKLTCGYSEVIESAKFEDFDTFMGAVQEAWTTLWKEVYESGASDGELISVPSARTSAPWLEVTPLQSNVEAAFSLAMSVLVVFLVLMTMRFLFSSTTTMVLGCGSLATILLALKCSDAPALKTAPLKA